MSYIVPQKMPMRCFECKEISSSTIDGYSCGIAHKSLASEHGINVKRPDWCPLIEIPTPHGRLGDLDELKAHYRYSEADSEDERVWMMNIRRAITNAPTVIEAEGEYMQ